MEYLVLKYLVNAPCRMVKCREMAEVLGADEERIRAAIRELAAAGYRIAEDADGGVRLTELTDVLDGSSVRLMLELAGVCAKTVCFSKTGSTNADAKRLAEQGFTGIVVAGEQTAGRGRRGRCFRSEPGGAYFSYVKRPRFMPASDMQKVVLLLGVGIADALEEFGVKASLKWPNDIMAGERKLGGILSEMVAEDNRVQTLILGVGVNVNNAGFDPELAEVATSMLEITGKRHLRAEVIAGIVKHVLAYDVGKRGYSAMLSRYRELSDTIGREVYVFSDDGRYAAKALDVDGNGFLLVETRGGVRKVVSGDVSIRRTGQ